MKIKSRLNTNEEEKAASNCGFCLTMKLSQIDISQEQKQLYAAFDDCLQKVKGKPFFEAFAKEKIKHSLQVVGAGNLLLKNEKSFQGKNEEFFRLGKLVCLFHDIGRFKEIYLLSKNPSQHYNHGHFSYDMLKDLGYSDLRLLLPVKRHGELADALDNDAEFQKMPEGKEKQETRELYGLVKDADKIANLYLIMRNERVFKDIFFAHLQEEDKYAPISDAVWQHLQNKELVVHGEARSFSDRLIQILCFVFEIYYQPSYDFIIRHKLFDNLYAYLQEYCPNKVQAQFVQSYIDTYLQSKSL